MDITNEQIEALETEAVEAGDDMQVCICRIALDTPVGGYMQPLSQRKRDRLIDMSRDEARELCAKAIADHEDTDRYNFATRA